MGLIKESMLVDELRSTADFLIAPLSFLEEDRLSVQTSFPSKMTEYTAAAMPILVLAPEYSSVAGWCRREPHAALLITELSDEKICDAISRLLNPPTRFAYGRAGAEIGKRYFDAKAGSELFISAVRRSVNHGA
jgi:hypothetical protein